MRSESAVSIKIVCHTMPGRTFGKHLDIELGIQRGTEVIDSVSVDVGEAVFLAPLRVDTLANGKPNFLGPYAHGTPDDRFIYLSWSGMTNGQRDMFRRVKIKLNHLSFQQIEKAVADEVPVTVRVNMAAKDGSPACATIKDIYWG